jgi:outer membrane protein with beta-barrel domain
MACAACAVLPILAGSAQTVRAAVRLGVTGGIQSTSLTGSWSSSEFTYNTPYDFLGFPTPTSLSCWAGEFGVVVEAPMRRSLALSTGLAWSTIGDRAEYMYTVNTPPAEVMLNTVHTNLQMIALPLRLEQRLGPWRFGLGLELHYLLRAVRQIDNRKLGVLNTDYPGGPGYHEWQYTRTSDVTDRYLRWSIAMSSLAGWSFPAGRHLLGGSVRWTEGITKVSSVEGSSQRIRAIQLALDLFW